MNDTTAAELNRATGTLTSATSTFLSVWLLATTGHLGTTLHLVSSRTTGRHLIADSCVKQVFLHFCTEDGVGEINLPYLLLIDIVYVYLGHPILLRHLDLDVDTGREVELK
jgi:hypothetical protein